jgi:hypothetical protein
MNAAIVSGVFSLVGGGLGAYLTVHFALRRFRFERWWDRKADAYSRIIESLHHMTVYCELELNEHMTGTSFNEDYKNERLAAYQKARRELDLATSLGAYIISDEAARLLKNLASRPDDENWLTQLDEDASEYRKVLSEIIKLAKKDLKVH